jgi:alanine racemase
MGLVKPYATWAQIDLGAIVSNIRTLADHTRTQIMAVVKANAYGHGAVPAAKAALRAGAAWCGVARASEALDLRRAGLKCPILILGLTPMEGMAELISARVSMTVWDPSQVRAASAAASQVGETARLHLKVDTGMSRLGVGPEQALGLARSLAQAPGVLFEGVFTHFARADEREAGPTEAQESLFQHVLEGLESAGLRPWLVHAANSAASLTRPSACFDMVRVGIAMYGLHPSPECRLPADFRPALSWKAQLSQVKVLPGGRGVSYGHVYTTAGEERIGTVPVGYADGFRRTAGNEMLVGGRRVPVVGRVCMDQCLVQLDSVPEAKPGDEVVLIGSQGAERITAEQVAQRWGTINYEVVCGIGSRVPRLYPD